MIVLLTFQLMSCGLLPSQRQDPFYTNTGGWDEERIPLLKPYSMVYLGKEYAWQMPLEANPPTKSTYYYSEIHDIREIAIENGVIMIYTPFLEPVDTEVGNKVLHWFAIVPAKNVEEGFYNESEFLAYVSAYGIHDPPWLDPNVAFQQFDKTGCLDWIPNCK